VSKLLIEEDVAFDLTISQKGEHCKYDGKSYIVHENEFVETTRWSILKSLVVEDYTLAPGRFWRVAYEEPATEMQETDRFDSIEDGKVAFTEVFPRERTVTEFLTRESWKG